MILFPRHLHTKTPSLEDFKFQRKLGEGTYGQVSKYIHKQTSLPYAIKRMSYKSKRKSQVLMIQKQIQILYRVRNKYIVQLIDHFQDVVNCDIYLIMEFVQGGDLYKSVYNKQVVLQIVDIATIAHQLCEAFIQLHRNNVIHRDLKLQNVIYLPDKSVKLVDLGCSNYYGQEFNRLTKIGTKLYYSPQILFGQFQDDRLDVWCLGVLIYELLFMKSPFRSNDLEQKIKRLQYQIPMPYDKEQEMVDMFKRIFSYKDNRIRADELIKHAWIVKNKRKQIIQKQKTVLTIISQEKMIKMKRLLVIEIEKIQQEIEKLKEQNQKLRIKIMVQSGENIFDNDSDDDGNDDCF